MNARPAPVQAAHSIKARAIMAANPAMPAAVAADALTAAPGNATGVVVFLLVAGVGVEGEDEMIKLEAGVMSTGLVDVSAAGPVGNDDGGSEAGVFDGFFLVIEWFPHERPAVTVTYTVLAVHVGLVE